MKFDKYQHVERFGKDEVRGLEEGECYVFSKLDGTNGSVWMDDGVVCCGSRNRQLSEDKDNAGFFKYIQANEPIRVFLEKYPNMRLYGEFLVPNQIKGYEADAWKKFYVFDVMEAVEGEEEERYLPYFDYMQLLQEFSIPYIPLIRELSSPTEEVLEKCLAEADYLMPMGQPGEGIVIKNYDYRNPYGHRIWGKMINAEFTAVKSEKRAVTNLYQNIEKEAVDKYLTEAFVLKEKAKMVEYHGEWNNRFLPELFGRVWHEFITEEMFHILKDYRNPTIHFNTLYQLVIGKIKRIVL